MRKRTTFAVGAGAALAVAGAGGAVAAPKPTPSKESAAVLDNGASRLVGHALYFGLAAAAGYLSVTDAELREALREGRSLAEVARAEGKPVGGLVDALVREQTARLDGAVHEGKLARARRDEIASRLKDRVERMVETQPLQGRRSFGPRHPLGGPPNAA